MDQLAGEYQKFSIDSENITKKVSDLEERMVKVEDHLGMSY
jgi:hypothetical protein